MPVIRCISALPEMLAERSICRTYQFAPASPSIISSVNTSTPSGKCPQKITEWAHRLRTVLAANVPQNVALPDPDTALGDSGVAV